MLSLNTKNFSRPQTSLPFQLMTPLVLPVLVTCSVAGVYLVMVAVVGVWVVLRQQRHITGAVSNYTLGHPYFHESCLTNPTSHGHQFLDLGYFTF